MRESVGVRVCESVVYGCVCVSVGVWVCESVGVWVCVNVGVWVCGCGSVGV